MPSGAISLSPTHVSSRRPWLALSSHHKQRTNNNRSPKSSACEGVECLSLSPRLSRTAPARRLAK